ncbi:3'-5' exonuclease isoform X2 [Corylus avellana]|uniref:3'-5' exonuclease isoform X2 n=1 Tax=Corylus avellana TaxID=13451 RepID=UPI00286D4D75|nr:3'-5' exonuclease isoform X2 [Corylus avellana]
MLQNGVDEPLTEQDLQAIDAAFQSATSSFRKKKQRRTPDAVISDPPMAARRLPRSLRALQHPNPLLSSCQAVNERTRYPALKFGGRIVYSRTATEVEKAAEELLKNLEAQKRESGQVVLGLDIEWRPSFRRGVSPGKAAIMQICVGTSHCHVMHIFHSGITQSLQFLLEDPIILKLEKRSKIRLGNWETNFLSKEQLEYAATDAFASWHLYQVLKGLSNREEEVAHDKGIKDLEGVTPS